jgi:hypothetical protein
MAKPTQPIPPFTFPHFSTIPLQGIIAVRAGTFSTAGGRAVGDATISMVGITAAAASSPPLLAVNGLLTSSSSSWNLMRELALVVGKRG